jgi:hypothetical protein
MSRNQNNKSKVITSLAVVGLLVALYAPGASAFDTTSYSGRYACNVSANNGTVGSFFTAVIRYRPNGSGAYQGGDLYASLSAFAATPTPGTADFCHYTLDVGASSYSIGADGTGNEALSWVADTTNNAACPASFVDQTAIGVRNVLDVTNTTVRAELVDADLLGVDESGSGTCYK